jgi:tetratricopeptide (TPR) repeat protein
MGKLHRSGAARQSPDISRPTPHTSRHTPKIPWRYIGIGIAVLILAGGGYFGVIKLRDWSNARRQAAATKRDVEDKARQTALEQSMRGQITTALGAAGTWQQKMQEGKTEEAEIAAKIALELQPNWRDGYLMIGAAQLEQKEYQDAQSSLEMATKLDPTHAPTHQLLAALFNQTGHQDAANQETAKAISLSKKTGIALE